MIPNQDYPPQQEMSNYQFNQIQPTPVSGPIAYLDPAAQHQINQGITQGFGQFFFNAHDPNIAKTNVPIKQQMQKHIPIIIVTILMIAGIAIGIAIYQSRISLQGGIASIITGYVIYLIGSIGCSEIRAYITNLKKFDDYKQTYDKMVVGRGYFIFWIQCYHYRVVKTKNGSRREKVVTHTATQNYFPLESKDQSGNLTGITDIMKYVFIKYQKKFYFTDSQSQNAFSKAYNSFVTRNARDNFQNHTQNFQIQGFQQEVGFCRVGESPHNSIVFYLFTFLGLSLPYSCILERSVARYSINILKRLSCA